LDTYDAIGRSYSTRRQPDPRLAARLDALIGCDSTPSSTSVPERVHTNPSEAELSLSSHPL